MKLLTVRFSVTVIFLSIFLSACSPHPATGVWKATEKNELGIDRLVVSFEGRAEFVTKALKNAVWHCFWSVSDKDKKHLNLQCSSSIDSKLKKSLVLSVNDLGLGELREWDGFLMATFTRLDENPSPRKK